MNVKPPIESISFIGLGLIGMSLLRALRRSSIALETGIVFTGFDPSFSETDKEDARILGLDRFVEDREELFSADIVVLAAPVQANIAMLDEAARLAPPSTIITDVSSTKANIFHRAEELNLPFIGMHPMAGKELQGFRESAEDLFKDMPIFLCHKDDLLTSMRAEAFKDMLSSVAGDTVMIDPDRHDWIMARISHLPQLISTVLIDYCSPELRRTGAGFASLTRLAGSPWEIWRDIIGTNSKNIADALEVFATKLVELSWEVRDLENESLESRFNQANKAYKFMRLRGWRK
ncbi:prephenate dehydrogenase [Pelodictyon luteolum]|uniref:Prephenate dehydrogenase n=1 Tax=Chlorobium luteolum (strain DSM 273 / BCRC 81028 / 2530) TaxID=319225 RepID=Q3B190_CHLL3|nr:prephenate dehydrogenase/arogenate dehydrogenase family protein [Pelodictyon luteolum]ABB24891.1 prephenate dehydrogenase [Pelodictyon luteolum DSM 273]